MKNKEKRPGRQVVAGLGTGFAAMMAAYTIVPVTMLILVINSFKISFFPSNTCRIAPSWYSNTPVILRVLLLSSSWKIEY